MLTTQISIENEVTLRNLQAAYEGESNAHAKYAAFAVKADGEGLHGAASLFRAARRAEQIHANNHAQVIRQLGAEPTATIHPISAKMHAPEPERCAIRRTLRDRLHVPRIYSARPRGTTTPPRSAPLSGLSRPKKAHARLFSEAIAVLESGWLIAARNFYVCTACGYTSESPESERCPTCNLPWEKFEVVR